MIRQWPLVGRSEELAVIFEATRTATADHARGIVLSGLAGVGKTRVAREAVARCGRRNARRHWIVGTATACGVPLGAFADVATDFGPDPLRRVREVIEGLVGDGGGEVIVGVDDAHLLDDLSAFTVHQLVTRRLATVILTVRTGDPAPDAITSLWKDQHLDRLELQPLSHPEIADLLEHVLGGPVDALSAQRLWQYTQGNTLYLRHLLANEVDTGRMTRRSDVWVWDGRPTLSPTLSELLEARIAQVPGPVCDVIDALTASEPLEADLLAAVTTATGLTEAETLGLVTIDHDLQPPSVRLAHPLLGEVRRSRSIQLRRLSGRIATELARNGDADPRGILRRAVLMKESDLPPDAELFVMAASAAMELMDLPLAERLASLGVDANGGVGAELAHAMAIIFQERAPEADVLLADLADRTTGADRAQVAVLRAFNLAAAQGRATSTERELEMLPADDEHAQAIAAAFRALIDLVRGDAAAAAEKADRLLATPLDNAVAHMVATWASVVGAGDIGRIDGIASVANAGYRCAEKSADVSHLRMPLAALHGIAYRLAGALSDMDAVIARIRHDTIDVPFQQAWDSFLTGMSAMSRGDVATSQRLLQESIAVLGESGGNQIKAFSRTWLAALAGMAGRAADARSELAQLDALNWWNQDPEACEWDAEKAIARAWSSAAEGSVSQAISIARQAADLETGRGRYAWEVMLLQCATQFGDATTAERLAELASQVQGPRAPAAAAHAAALDTGSGDALVAASLLYEEFGDCLAAADAAAHAVVAFQKAGRRGAAMTTSASVKRLVTKCQGAQTPALRAVALPQAFTARQREIISLAAQGLSNRDIAARLTMSVRSVEGHMFRASQRVGASSREQLIDMLRWQ